MKLTSVSCMLVVALGLAACGGGNATPDPKTPTTAAPKDPSVKAPGTANVGDKTTCPVSGEEFVVEASSPKVEHEGKTYYFCCSGCDKKFKADPAKYLKSKS